MKKAFVTGGSGHVGANLVRQLLEKGWTVRCLVHKDTRALENLDVERVQGDIVNPGQLTAKLKGIDTVFHCAAYVAVESVDIPLMETINIKGTEAICEASI
ncbi:MAG: NAD-dependent epimerase/dehydratase family protein, partial [Candidatus Marinimicrobia bacterium]|nr:NAD-dependent epimerase/dehydratase family protein [Candidatus Neomarinimicrobiota bacterium]